MKIHRWQDIKERYGYVQRNAEGVAPDDADKAALTREMFQSAAHSEQMAITHANWAALLLGRGVTWVPIDNCACETCEKGTRFSSPRLCHLKAAETLGYWHGIAGCFCEACEAAREGSDALARAFARRDALVRDEGVLHDEPGKVGVLPPDAPPDTKPVARSQRLRHVVGCACETCADAHLVMRLQPLVERLLTCPTCQRVYGRVRVEACATIEVMCEGCKREGRAR